MAKSLVEKILDKLGVNRKLIHLKVLLLFSYSGALAVWIYFPVILKTIGLSVEEMAIIYTVQPLTNIPVNAISGILADKLGTYKPLLIGSTTIYIIIFHLILYIPSVPKQVPTSLNVNNVTITNDYTSFSPNCLLPGSDDQATCNHPGNLSELQLNLHSCQVPALANDQQYISIIPSVTLCKKNNCQSLDLPSNADNITVSVVFYPHAQSSKECIAYSRRVLWAGEEYDSMTCGNMSSAGDSCLVTCQASVSENSSSSGASCPGQMQEGTSRKMVFILTFALNLAVSVFSGVCFTMHDATIFAMMKQHKGDYGKHRMCGMFGRIASPPLTGLLVDVVSRKLGYTTYLPAFLLADVLIFVAVILMCFLDVRAEKPQPNVMKNLFGLMRRVEVDVLFVVLFCIGTAWGYISIFIVWYIIDLGGSLALVGTMSSVASLVGLPFLYCSSTIMEKVGRQNLIALCCFAYSIKLMFYSVMWNPWWLLLSEGIGELFSYHLFWVSASTYANDLAGPHLRASMQAFIRALHFYLGRSMGSLVGGVLTSVFGMRGAFRVFSVFMLAVGIIYFCVEKLFLTRIRRAEKAKKQSETPSNEEETKPLN